MLCLKCPKRENCSELCPKAEKFVSRDYKSQRETLWEKEKLDIISDPGEFFSDSDKRKVGLEISRLTLADLEVRFSGEVKFSFLTKLQNKILTLHHNKVPRWQIARNLKINKRKVSNQLYTAKRKIKENLSKGEGEKT